MTFVNFSAHAPNPLAAGPQAAIDSAVAAPDGSFSFDDLLDIVNPLQHIPVVGTLYRAISGDTIKTGPKIAGDTLYGGITGFAASVADTMFEKITGRNVGDTLLAMVQDAFAPAADATAVASAAPPALPAPAAVQPAEQDAIVVPGQDELVMALGRAGIGRDVALRAADAYRRTVSVSAAAAALPSDFRATLAQ